MIDDDAGSENLVHLSLVMLRVGVSSLHVTMEFKHDDIPQAEKSRSV